MAGCSSMETARHMPDAWQKRQRVLDCLEDFERQLALVQTQADAIACVRATIVALTREQAGPRDGMYLMRSITRVATAVRRGGWSAIAAQLLDSAIERGLADEYVYAEAIRNRLLLGHWDTAERLLHAARHAGLSSTTAYDSLLTAYARHGWTAEKCSEFFECAARDRMLTDDACGALIKAHGKRGDVCLAESVFAYANGVGLAASECHVALINTYGHAGRWRDVRTVFDAARRRGVADGRLITAAVQVYCRAGLAADAERICDEALEQDVLVDAAVALLVDCYAQRGHFRRAERVLQRAAAVSAQGDAGYLVLASAYQRRGYFAAARRMRRKARSHAPAGASTQRRASAPISKRDSPFSENRLEERLNQAPAIAP